MPAYLSIHQLSCYKIININYNKCRCLHYINSELNIKSGFDVFDYIFKKINQLIYEGYYLRI